MNITQLNVFREVMATKSISQTARNLGRTQPAISLSLKNLEESLGLALFHRRGRQLIPVPEAHYLIAEVNEILDRISTVKTTMTSLRHAEAGQLNVAAMPGPSAFIFPRFISESIGGNADIHVRVLSRSSSQIRELASSQRIDMGFSDFEEPDGKVRQYQSEVMSADCFVAVHRDHRLSEKAAISVSDLAGEPIGTLLEQHRLSQTLAETFAKQEAEFSGRIVGQFFLPLLPFIATGYCCSIVDPLTVVTERMINMSQGAVIFIPFAAPVRYKYETILPLHRPQSKLAARIKQKWSEELFAVLKGVNSHPLLEQEMR